jgi:hypothetical protein
MQLIESNAHKFKLRQRVIPSLARRRIGHRKRDEILGMSDLKGFDVLAPLAKINRFLLIAQTADSPSKLVECIRRIHDGSLSNLRNDIYRSSRGAMIEFW